MEREALTIRLGRELQQLGPASTDADYQQLSHELNRAICQIKFIRKCYYKEVPSGR